MSKVYLSVKMNIIVDTDLNDVDEIMENMEIFANGNDDEVMVLDSEVTDFEVTDAD